MSSVCAQPDETLYQKSQPLSTVHETKKRNIFIRIG